MYMYVTISVHNDVSKAYVQVHIQACTCTYTSLELKEKDMVLQMANTSAANNPFILCALTITMRGC